jgi:hypothetical protein
MKKQPASERFACPAKPRVQEAPRNAEAKTRELCAKEMAEAQDQARHQVERVLKIQAELRNAKTLIKQISEPRRNPRTLRVSG